MNEDDKELLIATSERSKSNTHQIDEIKADIKQIKDDQKAIYDLTTSVKVIAENVSNMKDDLKEVKQGQSDLSSKLDNQITEIKSDVETKVGSVNDKVNELKLEPLEEMKKDKHTLKIELIKQAIGYALTGLVAIVGTLIGSGVIKL